jgi:hypothetical protein
MTWQWFTNIANQQSPVEYAIAHHSCFFSFSGCHHGKRYAHPIETNGNTVLE